MSETSVLSCTPGPWYVTRKFEVGPRSDADDQSNGMVIPIVDVHGENREADARLVAAAPDLLAALQDIVQRNEIQHWFDVSKAKAAIAKAGSLSS